jgi:uncharacterized protein (TIGR02271 family)
VYYVPRQEIAREDGNDWYLAVDKDDLDGMDWSQPPAGYSSESHESVSDEQSYSAQSQDTNGSNGAHGRVEGEGVRVVRYEEQLQAQKTTQQAGEAVLRKDVVEEVQTIEVPVRREELRIERHAVDGDTVVDGDQAFSGDTIRVPLMEEQVEVRKVARPVEEIEIGKVATEETQQVQETVRKERFDLDDTQVTEGRLDDRTTDR